MVRCEAAFSHALRGGSKVPAQSPVSSQRQDLSGSANGSLLSPSAIFFIINRRKDFVKGDYTDFAICFAKLLCHFGFAGHSGDFCFIHSSVDWRRL